MNPALYPWQDNPGDRNLPENLDPDTLVRVRFRGGTYRSHHAHGDSDHAAAFYWVHEDMDIDTTQYQILPDFEDPKK